MKNKMMVVGETNVAGVYKMETKSGVVLYVGSSLEIGDALSRHLYNLKRGKYQETNKRKLQEAYDREDLIFSVIKKSASNDNVRNMNAFEKENLQKALGMLEQVHINLNKDTITNSHMKVSKFSTSPTKSTTELRQNRNKGSMNPNNRFDEKLVKEILFLKNIGLKPNQIIELLESQGIEVKTGYISSLGVTRWIHLDLDGKRPEWYIEDEIAN